MQWEDRALGILIDMSQHDSEEKLASQAKEAAEQRPSAEAAQAKSPRKLRGWHLLVVLLVVAGIVGWAEYRHEFFPKRFGVVEQGKLYRSGQISPRLIKSTLQNNHIKVVVDLTGPLPDDPAQKAEVAAAAELGIVHKRYPLGGDGTGDINQYIAALTDIHDSLKEHKPVLVHCSAGAQRTGGVVAAYRMLVQNWSPQQAQQEMTRYGWNPVKDRILTQYLNEHMQTLAEELKQKGIISQVPQPLPRLPE